MADAAGADQRPFVSTRPVSIESRGSWFAAGITLAVLSISFGSPLLVVVGLQPMTQALGTDRSVIALAGSLVWIGNGVGGILMGWLADRIGIRATVAFGAVMMAVGLAVSTLGSLWALYVGHGLLIGLLGNGALYAPLVIHVSRWFDRRRGTAIALISSGQYVAGVVWPAILERGISEFGWQLTMLVYGGVVLAVILPLVPFLHRAPDAPAPTEVATGETVMGTRVLGFPANVTQALICVAGFLCCVPMAIPNSHLVAFCGDLGIAPTHGAAMLSVLLGTAFFSRQVWGAMADRYGGLRTILVGSTLQAMAIGAFLLTQSEAGLFAVAAAFGFGFSGLIPSYAVTIRDLYPSADASWRIPTTLFIAMSGMAFGSWFAGMLYDHFGYYGPAFAAGIGFNLLNIAIIGLLVSRLPRRQEHVLLPA